MKASQRPAAARPHEALPGDLYFAGPWVDTALMGGLAILFWFGLFFLFPRPLGPGSSGMRAWWSPVAAWAAVLLNFPHFAASAWPLYRNRGRLRRYPVTAFLIPFLVLFAVLLALHQPVAVLPAFCKLALLWLGFHFSMQTLGLCLLYARRAGLPLGRGGRFLFAAFIFLTLLHAAAGMESGAWPVIFLEVRMRPLGLPSALSGAALVLLCVSAVALAAYVLHLRSRTGRFPPLIVFLPALAQFAWFVLAPSKRNDRFFEQFSYFALFHGMQYLVLAWAVQRAERSERASSVPRAPPNSTPPKAFPVPAGAFHALLLVALGFGLFVGLPWLLWHLGIPRHLAGPAVWAGLWIHHALIDGVLWKPRGAVARKLHGLRGLVRVRPQAA